MTFVQKHFDFSAWWAFFAFSDEQLKEWLNWKPEEEYASAPWGMIVRKNNCKEMFEAFHKHCDDERNRRIKEVWLDAIIESELWNYEAWYTWEIDDAYEVLKEYWATRQQVLNVYREKRNDHE